MTKSDLTGITANRVQDEASISACQEIMQKVFCDELGFSEMQFPDKFESLSEYVELRASGELAGSFRIVKPNEENRCPATEMWKESDGLEPSSVCQFSRVAILPDFRGRGIFRIAVGAAGEIAREFGVSKVISEVLIEKQSTYASCGFGAAGLPIYDPTVDVKNNGDNNCIPMILQLD